MGILKTCPWNGRKYKQSKSPGKESCMNGKKLICSAVSCLIIPMASSFYKLSSEN